jgi:peptidoglycan hydrolase-like protein with peptidoglycan-binding domain
MRPRLSALIATILLLQTTVSASSLGFQGDPLVQQAQTKLSSLGFNPGVADGILGNNTKRAILSFQQQNGLPPTGALDAATLDKLGIQAAAPGPRPSDSVKDWRAVPTQAELDDLVADGRINTDKNPYADYRPEAKAANLDIPGQAILAAMNTSADTFGSRRPGESRHTDQGYKQMLSCLTNRVPQWSDLTYHYYCQMSYPRACYTHALRGETKGDPKKYPRGAAYKGCANGKFPEASSFQAFVNKTQPQVFQYVMLGQTNAFNPEQEQAVINAYYGVTNPADRNECNRKRPRRPEDPTDGTHCLVNKTMSTPLVGAGG